MNAKQMYAVAKAKEAALQTVRNLHGHKLPRWVKGDGKLVLKDVEEMFFTAVLRCHFSPQQLPEVMALAYSDKFGLPAVLRYGVGVGLLGCEQVHCPAEAKP